MNELEPIDPDTALALYLDQREGEVTESTHKAHEYRLGHFVRWAEGGDEGEERLANMNNLTGRALHRYWVWRRDDGDLNTVSMKTQMSTLRVFMKFCEEIDAVPQNTHQKVRVPSIDKSDGSRDSTLDTEKAVQILEHLDTYHYATAKHTVLTIIWHTGARLGGVHSLDVSDFRETEQRLYFEHREDTGTSLKNGRNGKRVVAISYDVTRVIADYVDTRRSPVTDDYGRKPLITTRKGRPNKTTLRDWVYEMTQPCFYTNECPHDKDIPDCEYRRHDYRAGCPSSDPPHDVRRGSITHHLSEDAPKEAVSDRMDVNTDTLDRHYDQRSEETKSEQRRDYFT